MPLECSSSSKLEPTLAARCRRPRGLLSKSATFLLLTERAGQVEDDTALMAAAESGSAASVQLILKAGADVNQKKHEVQS